MELSKRPIAFGLTMLLVASAVLAISNPLAAQRKSRTASAKSDPRAQALAVVDQFEKAYQRKDSTTMILRLMVPSTDNAVLEKRYQWLRGYGPNDPPKGKRPPILFQTSHGSFVPTKYSVLSSRPLEKGRYEFVVREEGTYRDEDGRYRVVRVRNIKLTFFKGKWYIMDYQLPSNTETYGFYVDDITDQMTKIE